MSRLSVTSINTRGLMDLVKCSSVFSFLHNEGHDIALLQECNLPYRSNYRPFQDRWKCGHSIWSGDNKNKSSGVVILLEVGILRFNRFRMLLMGDFCMWM